MNAFSKGMYEEEKETQVKAVVAERGQVTIPKALRERLGITPKTVLDFHEEDGRLVAQKASQADPVTQVLGCLKVGRSTDDLLAALRDER